MLCECRKLSARKVFDISDNTVSAHFPDFLIPLLLQMPANACQGPDGNECPPSVQIKLNGGQNKLACPQSSAVESARVSASTAVLQPLMSAVQDLNMTCQVCPYTLPQFTTSHKGVQGNCLYANVSPGWFVLFVQTQSHARTHGTMAMFGRHSQLDW